VALTVSQLLHSVAPLSSKLSKLHIQGDLQGRPFFVPSALVRPAEMPGGYFVLCDRIIIFK